MATPYEIAKGQQRRALAFCHHHRIVAKSEADALVHYLKSQEGQADLFGTASIETVLKRTQQPCGNAADRTAIVKAACDAASADYKAAHHGDDGPSSSAPLASVELSDDGCNTHPENGHIESQMADALGSGHNDQDDDDADKLGHNRPGLQLRGLRRNRPDPENLPGRSVGKDAAATAVYFATKAVSMADGIPLDAAFKKLSATNEAFQKLQVMSEQVAKGVR